MITAPQRRMRSGKLARATKANAVERVNRLPAPQPKPSALGCEARSLTQTVFRQAVAIDCEGACQAVAA